MPLPSPLPDDPRKWDGWRRHDSPDPYERLCLSFEESPANELIEEHTRQLLVWWQKKLPLKNQPSNPLAQLLRGGMDVAPGHLAAARAELLDPERRLAVDARLRESRREAALLEFQKFLVFALTDKVLTKDAELNLAELGRVLGLGAEDMAASIAAGLEAAGAVREDAAPPPSQLRLSVPTLDREEPVASARRASGSRPPEIFRRLLKLSRLDAQSMSLEQRDDFVEVAADLGLDLPQAEVLIDEYIGAVSQPSAVRERPAVLAAATPPPISVAALGAVVRSTRLVTPRGQPSSTAEHRRFPGFQNSLGAQMLLIPTGRFLMGRQSPEAPADEQPPTRVTLRRYYMSRYPVTNAQYEEFDPAHAARRDAQSGDTHPVVYVSHLDASRFCRWLTAREDKRYRLPTEAEWEYAARGSEGLIYPWANAVKPSLLKSAALVGAGVSHGAGGKPGGPSKVANFLEGDITLRADLANAVSGRGTSPVGEYPLGASPFGVEEMAGNVWEWCQDFYAPYRGAERINPAGPEHGTQRVCRGGSWKSRLPSLKTTTRGYHLPEHLADDVGFRIVCDCS